MAASSSVVSSDYMSDHVNLIINSSLEVNVETTISSASSSSSNYGWEASISYSEFVIGFYNYFYINIASILSSSSSSSSGASYSSIVTSNRQNGGFLSNMILDGEICLKNVSFSDVNLIIILTLLWTLLRHITTKYVFKVCSFCLLFS